MAKKVTNPIPSATVTDSVVKSRNPFLTFLTAILILTGIVDIVLWGIVVGSYILHGTRQSSSPNETYATSEKPVASDEIPTSSVDTSDGAAKRDALMAFILELDEIQPLDTEMVESFNSVSGDNYTDYDTLYAEISSRALPLCQQLNEKVLKIVPGDSEIEKLCKMLQNYTAKRLDSMIAITSNTNIQIAEINNQNAAADALIADFNQTLQRLTDERNVALDNLWD